MPCYHPIHGYRAKTLNPTGKRSFVFNRNDGFVDMPMTIPCGQCIGCRLDRSRIWAIRCVHESQLYQDNCFITLTYSDENLPKDGSVRVTEFQKFMKRLRFENRQKEIRFFHCGEYGESYGRPHYHACLFNHDFDDKTAWKTVNKQIYYVSEKLKKLWPQGHSTIGDVTFESAAYVARYIVKKITGKNAAQYYEKVDEKTGEILTIQPEYVTMSRRPGIGKGWFEKYKRDVYPHNYVVLRGKKMKPPKYYLDQLEKEYKTEVKKIKIKNKINADKDKENNTENRLQIREEIIYTKMKQLKRSYEI